MNRLNCTKTDNADSALISYFFEAMKPKAQHPQTPYIQELQQLIDLFLYSLFQLYLSYLLISNLGII
ncbi:putative transposase [Orientia tsutsugamushi str. TA716]|uniref:Putative transposase n=1 Tax=Orientia tsutsugamushi str. TA716 TaxID=1359175 RepID=A0A0F3NPB1_ORITS|nr:putative transposase [Orientia tsutsugamushi str. TA716]KJV75692.1 putative transposase [Orientia tsutsugamushi str. TA716]